MDIQEVEKFVAEENAIDFKAGEPMFKAFLIKSKDTSRLYVLLKCEHAIADGPDMLKLLCLMQDDPEARITN